MNINMQSFLITLFICTVTMSVISLLFIAVTPLLGKRYSEKSRYYAWLIILVGFIIPFRPQWGNALINVEVPVSALSSGTLSSGVMSSSTLSTNVLLQLDSIMLSEAEWTVSSWQIGFCTWLTGLIVFLVYHGIKHYRFAKISRRWSVNITDDHILSMFQTLKLEMGIKRHIHICRCASVGSPMMIGLYKPRILLPTSDLTHDELFFILKHELMHYKRKDLWYKHLVLAVTAIHWFNPLVFFMAKHIHNLCETSCDAEILRSADTETRQSYCKMIIGMMRNQSNLKTTLSTCFYGSKNNSKKRILSIMDTHRKKAGKIVFCTILLLILGTGCVIATTPADAENPPEIPSDTSQVNDENLPDTPLVHEESLQDTTQMPEEQPKPALPPSGSKFSLNLDSEEKDFLEELERVVVSLEIKGQNGIEIETIDGETYLIIIKVHEPAEMTCSESDGISIGPSRTTGIKIGPFNNTNSVFLEGKPRLNND